MAIGGDRPILIKKVKKVSGGGHHGGAWKVAYADFVTAMMAFFLLMWLINTTSPEQKKGVADYFAPASVSATTSGNGGILGGTALGDDGSKDQGSSDIVQNMEPSAPTTRPAASWPRPAPTPCARNWNAGTRRTSLPPPRACARRCRTCRNWPSCPSRSRSM
jgi:flagellar motor protein MotB